MSSVVQTVLLAPLPYEQPGQLVRFYQQEPENPATRHYLTGTHFTSLRDHAASFEDVAALNTYSETGLDLVRDGQGQRLRARPYAVRQRMQEIGIRMALGATAHEIRALVLQQAALVLGVGLVVGSAGAFVLGRWLTALVFQISPWSSNPSGHDVTPHDHGTG